MLRDALDDYFRTHPRGPERIARLERAVREQRLDAAGRRWYVGRENRRLWVPRTEREIPEELVAGGWRRTAPAAPADRQGMALALP